jgi:hypothetical protein
MKQLTFIIGLLFLTLSCNSQTNKKLLPSAKPQTQTSSKKLKLEFLSLSIGDLAHYTFKDLNSGKEIEVEFDKNDSGFRLAKEEIDKYCDGEGDGICKVSGQKYDAVMQYKLVDIYDWNGEEPIKSGKKEKRWILIKLFKG